MREQPSVELLMRLITANLIGLTTDAVNVAPQRLLLSISSKPLSLETLLHHSQKMLHDSPGLAVFLGILDDKQLLLLQRR
jgi:hypothetical protein